MHRNRIRLLLFVALLATAAVVCLAIGFRPASAGASTQGAVSLGTMLAVALGAVVVVGLVADRAVVRLLQPLESMHRRAEALQVEATDREEHDLLIQVLKEQLSKVTDVDLLLHLLLNSSLEFSRCEAGSIWIVDQNQLVLWYARNLVLEARTPHGRMDIVNARIPISSSSIAGHCVVARKQVVIDDVYNLPADSPFRFDQSFDRKSGFRTRCMISIPLFGSQGAALGVMQLINPAGHTTVSGTPLAARTESFALLAGLVLERAWNAREFLMRLVRTVEIRDPHETGVHVQCVSDVACHLYKVLADKRNMPPHQRDQNISVLRVAALLHDIGKVGIPDAILKKPGKLDDEEFNLMKWHTVIGAKLFAGAHSDLDKAAADVARYHHERWDGGGYPGAVDLNALGGTLDSLRGVPHQTAGLKGAETPLFARLVAIADVFDALASRRAYKDSWSDEKIKETIRAGSGTHFDPEIVEVFLDNYAELKFIRERI
jgi:HD-GYP domain-containing protein (c-di-GMP phosphodiesterase class II)